jgi:hypothetical protein
MANEVNNTEFIDKLNEDNNNYVKRRKSDSNLTLKAPQFRKRSSQMSQQQQQINKSISSIMAEKQLARQPRKENNPQEDTFYRALEIKFHHSVGSMSISPACRDVVLAG